jgi:hypothetical protein
MIHDFRFACGDIINNFLRLVLGGCELAMAPGRFVVSEYSRADEYQYCQRCAGGFMHKICCLNMLEISMVARKFGGDIQMQKK